MCLHPGLTFLGQGWLKPIHPFPEHVAGIRAAQIGPYPPKKLALRVCELEGDWMSSIWRDHYLKIIVAAAKQERTNQFQAVQKEPNQLLHVEFAGRKEEMPQREPDPTGALWDQPLAIACVKITRRPRRKMHFTKHTEQKIPLQQTQLVGTLKPRIPLFFPFSLS